MVSLIWSPAASVAFTRRLTKAPGGAVNVTLNRPPPAAVTVAGCQVVPPLTDTATVAPVILDAGARCRCPTVSWSCCCPGGATPSTAIPLTPYSRVIIGCTAHRCVPLMQIHPAGRLAPGLRAVCHVHTVRLVVDRRERRPGRVAVSTNLITPGVLPSSAC